MSAWLLVLGVAAARPDLPSPPALGAAPRALSTDWQTLSPLLRVRPFATASLSDAEAPQVAAGIGRTPTDGLRFAIVVETPDTVGIVGAATAERWAKSEAEVYAVARAHTRASLQADFQRTATALPGLSGSTVPAEVWTGGDTVSTLTDLDTFLGPAPYGALLSAPTRDLVVVHRLAPDAHLPGVLATFAAFATVGASADQEPFSGHLYWWHDGQLRTLVVEDPDPGRPRVVPGPTLEALQRSLQPTPKR